MQTLAEALERLESIVAYERSRESAMVFFPVWLFQTAETVRHSIKSSRFENGARMDRLMVVLLRRYFEAYDARHAGKPCSLSWQAAFDAAVNEKLTVLQHLLLGLNASLNLDLSIAAAEIRPGETIFGLRPDFERLSETMATCTLLVWKRMFRTWLPHAWLDQMLRTEDDGLVHFSLKNARYHAWRAAASLAMTTDKLTENALIQQLDSNVAALAQRIVKPGWVMQMGLNILFNHEKDNFFDQIDLLTNPE